MFFTVVIPVYNSSAYIGETLKSLSEQTFKDFEVILIDDDSFDDSVSLSKRLLEEYKLQGYVVARPKNFPKGVSGCRNYGIEQARGEWICFLDSDDLYFEEKLERTHSAIQKHGSFCLAYFTGVERFDDVTGARLGETTFYKGDYTGNIADVLYKSNIITTSTVTIQRSLLLELSGFNTSLNGVEDYLLWVRVAKETPWNFTRMALTKYRVRTQSLMGGRPLKFYVQQYADLMKAAKLSGEFQATDIRALQKKCEAQMNYYASHSLNQWGWQDFLLGLHSLAMLGGMGISTTLLRKHVKFSMLRLASRLAKNALKRKAIYPPSVPPNR
jgi:glycosyltransferase involved in cell wall biosynthesis